MEGLPKEEPCRLSALRMSLAKSYLLRLVIIVYSFLSVRLWDASADGERSRLVPSAQCLVPSVFHLAPSAPLDVLWD